MNGKTARALRKVSTNRSEYQALKRFAHADQGQHPKPLITRFRRSAGPAKPTWPATANQKRQSRPMIVLRPAQQFDELAVHKDAKHAFRAACHSLPKCELDRIVLREYL